MAIYQELPNGELELVEDKAPAPIKGLPCHEQCPDADTETKEETN